MSKEGIKMIDAQKFYQPGQFVKHLMEECAIESTQTTKTDGTFEISYLDLTKLKIRSGHFTPFISAKSLSGKTQISWKQIDSLLPKILKIPRHVNDNFLVFLVGGKLIDSNSRFLKNLYELNIALLDSDVIGAVLKSKSIPEKHQALCAGIINILGLETLSPYIYGKPASGASFFGRASSLKLILSGRDGKNFTIMGSRRIGKTSLMREIKGRLTRADKSIRVAEIYGNKFSSTFNVALEILQHLDMQSAEQISKISNWEERFPSYIKAIPDKKGERVAVFIDELDHILEFDELQDYQLIKLLQAAFDHDGCRIFMAGFRKTLEAKEKQNTPIFNFTAAHRLRPFTREETQEMVTTPLSVMGINLSKEEIIPSIYRESAGYPELIQMFCSELISFFEQERKVPDATKLLSHIFGTQNFEQSVVGSFMANTNSIEELLCYLLMEEQNKSSISIETFEFGYEMASKLFDRVDLSLDVKQLREIMQNLIIGGYISDVKGAPSRFRFSLPQLVRYCLSMDLEFLKEKTLQKVKTTSVQNNITQSES